MGKIRTIQSIDRTVMILNYIAKHNNNVRFIDISNDLNLKKGTLHGILSTLEYNNLLSKDKDTNRYSLGIKLYEFGKIYEEDFSIKKIVRPYLEKLGEKFSETIHLAIESDYEVLYIDRVKSSHSVRMASKIGHNDPLYCSAIGKVILANMENERLKYYLENYRLYKRTENTITDKKNLKNELDKIKNDGYSIDNEELEAGLICVASPIKNQSGDLIAVISISGPTSRISKDEFENMESTIIETSKIISESIGYKNI
ncbi:MAG: IclR family transcriptional regulator [Firmicutes bacterium]|nr:IclR family transcriptional regulator [Bacillota bacterium]